MPAGITLRILVTGENLTGAAVQGADLSSSNLTVAQLQSLDFAAMDFTEFYASLVPTSPNVANLQTNSASRIPACYYGQGRCQ